MPIIDIELVCDSESELRKVSANELADVLGSLLKTEPGTTWVRLRALAARNYAENRVAEADEPRPVFVTILKAQPPRGAALAEQLAAVTRAVSRVVGRPAGNVHVLYSPPAAGRQGFGDKLVK